MSELEYWNVSRTTPDVLSSLLTIRFGSTRNASLYFVGEVNQFVCAARICSPNSANVGS